MLSVVVEEVSPKVVRSLSKEDPVMSSRFLYGNKGSCFSTSYGVDLKFIPCAQLYGGENYDLMFVLLKSVHQILNLLISLIYSLH
jgi:hypothetical protein